MSGLNELEGFESQTNDEDRADLPAIKKEEIGQNKQFGADLLDGFKEPTEALNDHLKNVREGMRKNVERLKHEKSERIARKKHLAADPQCLDSQLNALIQAGIRPEDIVVGYTRISGLIQEAAYGEGVQKDQIQNWCRKNTTRGGVDIFVSDRSSGKLENRIGLNWIRDAVAQGKIKKTYVFRFDRMARTLLNAEIFRREFEAAGAQILSVSEEMPKGFLGRLTREVLAAISEYESALIVDRMMQGKKRAILAGAFLSSITPYGYTQHGKGRLEICEEEAETVRLIFAIFVRGFCSVAIAQYLTSVGIPIRKGLGFRWSSSTVSRIIRNEPGYRSETLIGAKGFLKTDVVHPNILPHRPDPKDRPYLYGNIKTLPRGSRVPSNFLTDSPVDARRRANTIQNLTRAQATALLLGYRWRDAGMTYVSIARKLNQYGLFSPGGFAWTGDNLRTRLSKRARVEAAAAKSGITNIFVPVADPCQEDLSQGEDSVNTQCRDQERIHEVEVLDAATSP